MNSIMIVLGVSLCFYMPSTMGLLGGYGSVSESSIDSPSPRLVIAKNLRKGDLVFIDSNSYKSKDGKYFYVKGTLKNVVKISVKKVTVTVRIYDKDNNELEKKSVPLTPDVLRPGEEGTFEVQMKFNEKMHGYQKTVEWKTSVRD